MNRFNFFGRPATAGDNTTAHPSNNAHGGYDDADPYDDRTPLSPRRPEILADDIEAQHPSAAATAATREMAERGTPTGGRFLHRFRPTIPSFFSTASSSHPQQQQQQQQHPRGYPFLRPTSSHYSGAGLRGAPDTVLDLGLQQQQQQTSPKSPEFFRIDEQALPSTRLHLPNLARTWSQGSNGPPTRPGTAAVHGTTGGAIAEPEPAVVHSRRHGSRSSRRRREEGGGEGDGGGDNGQHRERRRRRRGDRSGSGSGSGSGRSGSHRSRSSREDESRSERRARRERRERRRGSDGERGSRTSDGRPPKNFLFCFPWIKSRRIRSQILRCFVSGLFVALTLAIYLSLSLTKNITSNEFTILLIIILLFITIFFCHSLIRLCMLVVKARKREQAVQQGRLPEMAGPGGYAIPREPIAVVLARDEEAAGIESEATKTGPPAYGVWRESVRVDPDRLYWMRNQHATVEEVSDTSSSSGFGTSSSGSGVTHNSNARTTVPRPPSYSSDDGVSYVVEARPRSMAPRGIPLAGGPHPSESGISGSWV